MANDTQQKIADIIRRQGLGALDNDATLIASNERYGIRYTPFEYTNPAAKLTIVGITPGPDQLQLAYARMYSLLVEGRQRDTIGPQIKAAAAFSGDLRDNLVRMLEHFQIHARFGLESAHALWGEASHLLESTSVVPHAVFKWGSKNGRKGWHPFAGSFDEILRVPILKAFFETEFVPRLALLPSDVRCIALGPTALEALDWCIQHGHLAPAQVLGGMAHPSGNGGSQIDIYLGTRDPESLSPRDPVRHRVGWLLTQRQRMEAAVRAWETPSPAEAA